MLRLITVTLALLFGANASMAQNAQPKSIAAAKQLEHKSNAQLSSGRITGQVILSDTHKPGRGIGVNISRGATPGQHDAFRSFAVTDSEGRYNFDHLKPGDYFINIRTNGYLYLPPPDTTQPSSGRVAQPETYMASNKITLHPNEFATFDVMLQRSASLSGYVYFDDGSPAINTEIRVEQIDPGPFYKPEPGAPSYMPIMRAGDRRYTDERGYFRITTLGTGTYRIAASPALQPRAYELDILLSPEEEGEAQHPANLTVFSGDTIHRSQAKTYKLRPGDEVSDIRITIPLAGLYKVGGTIGVNDGRTPNEGLVTLVDSSDKDIHFRTTLEKSGGFLFAAIPNGTYKLTLSHAHIAKPDTSSPDYTDDDTDIDTNAFSDAESTVIVKNSDNLDLHFEVHEIAMPQPLDNNP